MKEKIKEIREFCKNNSDPAVIAKYSKYFKEGYDGYGVGDKIFREQKDKWYEAWKSEMNIQDFLDLGDALVSSGKFEEIAFAIHFISLQPENYTPEVFERVGKWLDKGIENWASTDVLCMLVLSSFIKNDIIKIDRLKDWTDADSKWKRRAVPVTMVQMAKSGTGPGPILPVIEPLMNDDSEDVQKGLGTLLRELWKKHKDETEVFLMKWKDICGRLIIRYATEKMDKELRVKFKKIK